MYRINVKKGTPVAFESRIHNLHYFPIIDFLELIGTADLSSIWHIVHTWFDLWDAVIKLFEQCTVQTNVKIM